VKPFVISSILAPTDLTEASLPALRYARLLADHFLAKVAVMYSETVVYPLDLMAPMIEFYLDAAPETKERLRSQIEQHAGPAMAGKPFDVEVMVGQPIPAIVRTAKERNADLIVMGTHLRHGIRRALLGSVSEGVLHESDCPVLTVASHDDGVGAMPYAITNILCPVNFTEVARQSLHVAAGIALAFNARLTIVHVVEDEQTLDPAADEERMRRWVAPELEDLCSYRELVVRGGPAARVLDCADDVGADLLVIGAQHRIFRDTTVIGATSDRLMRFATCPVLVVPRPVTRHTEVCAAPPRDVSLPARVLQEELP
jgi:nucleotide-binding universal stress UspA family protein